MKYFQNDLGFGYKDEKVLIFFGNKNAELVNIAQAFPAFKFLRVKQTHSDIFVAASEELQEADAHWTGEKNIALIIATTDCMPIMIYCEQTHRVAAVHAGWRGVVNGIIEKNFESVDLFGQRCKTVQNILWALDSTAKF